MQPKTRNSRERILDITQFAMTADLIYEAIRSYARTTHCCRASRRNATFLYSTIHVEKEKREILDSATVSFRRYLNRRVMRRIARRIIRPRGRSRDLGMLRVGDRDEVPGDES